jgi:uncharacterized protein
LIRKYGFTSEDSCFVQLLKRSIDARSRQVRVNIRADLYVNEPPGERMTYRKAYHNVSNEGKVIIIGSGPAGLFAALRFLELGIKPVILERGKDVRARRRDLAAINRAHVVDPDSNYCFGEGGAGTYSDGKLYTRSKKRGNFDRILEIFVAHEANPIILVESHPHIGTNKLPKVVGNIRQSILDAGGEIHFETRVVDLIIEGDELRGVTDQHGNRFSAEAVMLATGHSARDIYDLLHRKGVFIERKSFALGVRVEHPQTVIDRIQYHAASRGPYLPAASYSLVTQVAIENRQKGVFSFCMCPGGWMVPAATAPGEIVINGMSPSRRDSKFANSGIVVPVDDEDLRPFDRHGVMAGIAYQQAIEQKAFRMGGGTQAAPAQRLMDFLEGKTSQDLPASSYQPGLSPVQLNELLPAEISQRLKIAFRDFEKKMRGYLTNEAQLVAVESRTSSPVRITRDPGTNEHVHLKRLFPAGEGAGYAGGIASAAIDGENCANRIAEKYFHLNPEYP